MDMIRHDSKIMNNNMILCCCLTNGSSNKIFILQLTHHLIPILRTPLKMPKVSAFFMAVMMYYFHTLVLHGTRAHAIFLKKNMCAATSAQQHATKPHKNFSIKKTR